MSFATLSLFLVTIICFLLTFVVSASRENRNSEWKEWLEIFFAVTTVYLYGRISQEIFGYSFIVGWVVGMLTLVIGYNLQFRKY